MSIGKKEFVEKMIKNLPFLVLLDNEWLPLVNVDLPDFGSILNRVALGVCLYWWKLKYCRDYIRFGHLKTILIKKRR